MEAFGDYRRHLLRSLIQSTQVVVLCGLPTLFMLCACSVCAPFLGPRRAFLSRLATLH